MFSLKTEVRTKFLLIFLFLRFCLNYNYFIFRYIFTVLKIKIIILIYFNYFKQLKASIQVKLTLNRATLILLNEKSYKKLFETIKFSSKFVKKKINRFVLNMFCHVITNFIFLFISVYKF